MMIRIILVRVPINVIFIKFDDSLRNFLPGLVEVYEVGLVFAAFPPFDTVIKLLSREC